MIVSEKDLILNKYYYQGAIHIHSLFSDGSGNIEDISLAAKKAGLDYVIITDHNNIDIEEGIYNGVVVVKGQEVSLEDKNHYLVFGTEEKITPQNSIQAVINEVRSKKGYGFAAHPDESHKRNNKHNPIKWTDKNVIPDGVEIWNWFSAWADEYNDHNILKMIYAYLFRHRLVKVPSKTTLNWWDKINNSTNKIIPATGGLDAHALKIKKYIIPVTIFPYKKMFKTITNVVVLNEILSEDFNTAKKQILTAIKNGNNIIVNKKINNSLPVITVENKNKTVSAGERINLDNATYLNVKAPQKSLIKIFHNGAEIYNSLVEKCRILLTKVGKYRVEILINGYGFSYTNPILVTEE